MSLKQKPTQRDLGFLSRLFEPARLFIVVLLVVLIYLLPLGEKPEFIEHNGEIVAIPQNPPILESFYPQGITASCNGGPGFNCNTGCCRADQCVVCPEDPPTPTPIYPPTITASLVCSSTEVNSWCPDSYTLYLNASDPQGAAVIISGSVNGTAFACQSGATSCSIPIMAEGTGPITYRVDSATGQSDSDSTSYKIDLTTPQVGGSLNGTPGLNNYYISSVTASGVASDNLSGIASFDYSLDNGNTWNAYIADVPFTTDGAYSIMFRACDYAGLCAETPALAINIDTVTPFLNLPVTGTMGGNNYYITLPQITVISTDSGSGIASTQISIDGAPYVAYTTPITLSDGRHTYQAITRDYAGLFTESPLQEIQVDTTFPTIDMTEQAALGDPVYFEIVDNGSELSMLRFVIEDEDERFKKVVWEESLNGKKHKDSTVGWGVQGRHKSSHRYLPYHGHGDRRSP